MNVLLFGATGMVGQGVLRECLQATDVQRVTTIGRTPTRIEHPKARDLLVPDLLDFRVVEADLTGYDACFFCLGVSSTGMNEAQYTRITYDLTLAAAEGGADDVSLDGSTYQVIAPPESLSSVREAIEAAGIEVQSAELTMVPKTTIELEDEATAKKVLRLIDALEDNDDVQDVYANFDIPERVLEAVAS